MDLQQEAIRRINGGESIFLTGSGGVGKSWVIDQVNDENTLLCAPSGIAALNIGGITCHRAFALPLGIPTDEDFYKIPRYMWDTFSGNAVKRIIIDEVGMLRTDYFVLISRRLQRIRGNDLPFGGIQVVLVGDFYQLEPILKHSEQEYFDFASKFCFGSKLWDFPTIELTDVKRQSNKRQVLMLNSIRRKDKHYKKALEYIQKECKPYEPDDNTLHLCCYNKDADYINQLYYSKMEGEERCFYAKIPPNWGKERPVDEVVRLKVGTRVLIAQNCPQGTYVNGDRGVVVGFRTLPDGNEAVEVEKDDETICYVVEGTWEKYSYSKVKDIWNPDAKEKLVKAVDSRYIQMPIKLGWAVSVHKSQGMTLDDVAIDVGSGCFSHGQAYVALSRIKDLRNLSFVKPMLPEDIIVNNEVKKFYGDA
ncbi:MAG: putative ATP-dependent DNA helicase [Prokaryotic dsDNA virus sp.]|jgi:ATP-dependent exoDNAse (exonuclease V) alpha subunit|nr:MAG: putative ATP-dependent DNA helicase [Prokaryotic dsDNA virus sp.]|tara:strand:- start:32320 stop:33579 length:1260 start_codon:yes stop_codon:yes gene_type:complete